jgi:hypothetical protein
LLVPLVLAALLLPAADVAAQANETDERIRNADGRLRGYEDGGKIVLEGGDTPVLAYAVFLAMTGVVAGVMFKNSRRTHLD